MKKILIVNLLGEEEILSAARIVDELKKENETYVSMLIFKEFNSTARLITQLDSIIEIDRGEINTLMSNSLFSNGFALEYLYQTLQEVKSQSWQQVINFSNDQVATLITSYFQDSSQIIGTHFNSDRNVYFENEWSSLYNDSFSEQISSPIHQIDNMAQMLGLELSSALPFIAEEERFALKAKQQLKLIKQTKSTNISQIKIVAIDLPSLERNSLISSESIVKILNDLSANPLLIPIVTISHHFEDRNIANNYNLLLNNNLIIVECGPVAMRSVLAQANLLLTSKSLTRILATSIGIPVLDISPSTHGLLLGNHGYGKDVYVLQSHSEEGETVSDEAILASLFYILSDSKIVKPQFKKVISLYQANYDDAGIVFSPVAGNYSPDQEINKIISRHFLYLFLNEKTLKSSEEFLKSFSHKDCSSWLQREKEKTSTVSADILATIRDLLQFAEKKANSKNFVHSLGKILSRLETTQSLASLPIKFFKNKLESIPQRTLSENVKEVEALLYELKNNVQTIHQLLNAFEVGINNSKVEKALHFRKNEPQSISL